MINFNPAIQHNFLQTPSFTSNLKISYLNHPPHTNKHFRTTPIIYYEMRHWAYCLYLKMTQSCNTYSLKENLYQAVLKGDKDEVDELLNNCTIDLINQPIFFQDATAPRLLHLAAMQGYTKICESLIQKGALVDIQNDLFNFKSDKKEPKTPLGYAIKNGHSQTVKILLMYGAQIDQSFLTESKFTGYDALVEFSAIYPNVLKSVIDYQISMPLTPDLSNQKSKLINALIYYNNSLLSSEIDCEYLQTLPSDNKNEHLRYCIKIGKWTTFDKILINNLVNVGAKTDATTFLKDETPWNFNFKNNHYRQVITFLLNNQAIDFTKISLENTNHCLGKSRFFHFEFNYVQALLRYSINNQLPFLKEEAQEFLICCLHYYQQDFYPRSRPESTAFLQDIAKNLKLISAEDLIVILQNFRKASWPNFEVELVANHFFGRLCEQIDQAPLYLTPKSRSVF